jgi:midasin (ATPase involved in ribosome maturation)
LATEFEHHISTLKQSRLFIHTMEEKEKVSTCLILFSLKYKCTDLILNTSLLQAVSSNISVAPSTVRRVNEILSSYKKEKSLYPGVTEEDIDAVEKVKLDLIKLHQKWQAIFLWQDGPLVEAMKGGDLFLVDEISLADDSVLERLNSMLEPERKLVS